MESKSSTEVTAELEYRLNGILEDMNYKYRRSIIVWCPTEQLRPDYVVTLLARRDPKVEIQNHWVSPSVASHPLFKVWTGALAQFSSIAFARLAARDLRKHSRCLKVLPFEDLVSVLREAEVLHPKPAGRMTILEICGLRPFDESHKQSFKSALALFGRPRKLVFYCNRSSRGVVAKVSYPSLMQAYAARFALDGMFLEGFGDLTVSVHVSPKGQQFDDRIRNYFKDLVNDT